jgi:anti-anti-sigma factor
VTDRHLIDQHVQRGVLIVTVTGEVDIGSGTQFVQAAEGHSGPVVIDARPCTFMDSEGLKGLLMARQVTTDRGDRLVILCEPENAVAQLLKLTGTLNLFNVCRDLEASLALAAQRERRQTDRRRRAA